MKKVMLCLLKGKYIILVFSCVFLLVGLLIANFTAHDTSYLCFKYQYQEKIDFDFQNVISEVTISRVKALKKSFFTGKNISTYQYVDIKDISITKETQGYVILVNRDSFNLINKDGIREYNDTAAKGFLKHLTILGLPNTKIEEANTLFANDNPDIKGVSQLFDETFYEANSLTNNFLNQKSDYYQLKMMTLYSFIGLFSGFALGIIFVLFFIKHLNKEIVHEYDNVNIFRTPFHLQFFSSSLKYFKDLKSLVSIALLLSLVMICKFIPIPSGFGELGLSFGFIFLAIACMLYGPYPALMIGFLSDTIGYLINPNGLFFFGYTLQAMFACLAYALCFYKTHITFSRTLIARLLVNLIGNAIIGTICRQIIMGLNFEATYTYFMIISLPKNLVYLLPQSLVLYFVIKCVTKPLSAMNLVDSTIAKNISFF